MPAQCQQPPTLSWQDSAGIRNHLPQCSLIFTTSRDVSWPIWARWRMVENEQLDDGTFATYRTPGAGMQGLLNAIARRGPPPGHVVLAGGLIGRMTSAVCSRVSRTEGSAWPVSLTRPTSTPGNAGWRRRWPRNLRCSLRSRLRTRQSPGGSPYTWAPDMLAFHPARPHWTGYFPSERFAADAVDWDHTPTTLLTRIHAGLPVLDSLPPARDC